MAPDPHGARSQDVCGYYGLEIRPYSGPERSNTNDTNILLQKLENLGFHKIGGPVSPQYSTYTSRLESFKDWPIPEIQSPEKLAEAGYYYISVQDNVLCFHCGGGLKNWEVGDDPWVEHARWFRRCAFVLLQKGKEFVDEVLAKDAAYALGEVKETKNKSDAKVEPKEENIKEKKNNSKSSSTTSKSTSTSTSTSQSTWTEEKLSPSSKSSNCDKKELSLCRICYSNEREIVFLPCGHFVSCAHCAPSLGTCAVCRKPLEGFIRAYLS